MKAPSPAAVIRVIGPYIVPFVGALLGRLIRAVRSSPKPEPGPERGVFCRRYQTPDNLRDACECKRGKCVLERVAKARPQG